MDYKIEQLLKKTLQSVKLGNIIEATDFLISALDQMLSSSDFDNVSKMLRAIDTNKFPPSVLTGILTISKFANSELKEARTDFFIRVMNALEATWNLSKNQLERITSRLQ